MAETKRTLLERIDRNLLQLLAIFAPISLQINFGNPKTRQLSGVKIVATTIKDTDHFPDVQINALDGAGNPVRVTLVSPAVWSSSDETVATATVGADGKVDVSTTGKIGTAQIKAVATLADNTVLTGLGDLEVVLSGATTFSINFGTAVAR